MIENFKGKRVLILSPHTDDAELGCGGLISRLVMEKADIFWIVFSTAKESVPEGMAENTLQLEFINVVSHLGLSNSQYKVYDFKVRRLMEHRQDVLDILVNAKKEFNPQIVLGPSLNDYHQDHIAVSNEMVRAFKSSATILSYELPWNHLKFEHQLFIKISKEELSQKIEMLKFYKSQFSIRRNYFSEQFIEGLARTRAAQINEEFAEAFEIVKMII
jgi:LmbE family N-acetylglucosaminyl deacetylase